MPSEQELAIILRFRDLATSQLTTAVGNIRKQLVELAERGKELGQNMKVLGREISQVGSSMMMLGTAITAPLVLAFKNAEKYSLAVSQEMRRLANITRELQVSIAEALAPVIHNLTNFLGRLLNAWNSLTPAQQQAIVQTVFMGGVYLMMTGTVVKLIGTMTRLVGITIKWASSLALLTVAHPILAAIAVAVIAIAVAMIKWESMARIVLNTLEVGLKTLYGAIKLVEAAFWKVAQAATWMLPGVSAAFKKMADTAYAEAQKATEDIGKVFEEGAGRWAENFEEFKQKIAEIFEMFQNPPEFNIEPMTKIFNIDEYMQQQRDSIEELKGLWTAYQDERLASELARMQQEAEQYNFLIENQKMANKSLWTIAGNLRDTFSKGISTMFMNMIKGVSNVKEAFKEMGYQMLQIVIDYIAQTIIAWTIGKALTAVAVAISIATAGALAAAWATPAYLASVATLGGAAAIGAAALATGMGVNLATVAAFQTAATTVGAAGGGGGGLTTLQEGGIVERPTLALLGERGKEAVIPLERGGITGLGGNYIHIEMNYPMITSEKVADEIINKIIEEVSYILSKETERYG